MAAETSPSPREPASDELTGWIAALPAAEEDALLSMMAGGESTRVQSCCRGGFMSVMQECRSHGAFGVKQDGNRTASGS